jgi:rare lipoprotein A (peptidoglycan hydrolase)
MQGSLDEQQAYYDSLSGQVRSLLDAQERAAKAAKAGNGDVANVSAPKKGAPKPSSGSVALKKVTVTGRGGSWWAMASDSDSFSPTGVKFSGKATLYSVAENGTGTSSGRPLNDNELTCAHRTLPFGTRVAVKHGGRQIIVVVTDRGPYTSGRVIDLTLRGARLLGVDGVGSVSCEVVEGN